MQKVRERIRVEGTITNKMVYQSLLAEEIVGGEKWPPTNTLTKCLLKDLERQPRGKFLLDNSQTPVTVRISEDHLSQEMIIYAEGELTDAQYTWFLLYGNDDSV